MGTKSCMPDSSVLMKLIRNCFVIFASLELAAILQIEKTFLREQ